MINGESVLAVIPARGGSKRAPRKNGKPFRGRMLFSWSISAAKSSAYIDQLVFSSDVPEWLQIASIGTDCLIRPPELATDGATNEDVLRDAMRAFPGHDWIVLLQPTSPLRTAADIDECIRMASTGWGCVSYNEETHAKNGAVYVAHADWLAKHDFSHAGLRKYMMPAERSLDIDYPEQFDA